ncbi:LamG-like jellyroll fold domain-containing protein [Micromonospora eburnea]|uniref:Concanavalin A-like lectin/glucanases superfamily protein n=1 Tax=Micromonospora eburnea TaxID=227316 RepID=A0A1C6VEE3_9ACTN|nr:LamG-like jellyroll fold domain-containing protein [Micromonospora eburnea]SCL64497.1 Concanavalin A-like lectin/glucanases superfamily protein [Micromonospora eburnea]
MVGWRRLVARGVVVVTAATAGLAGSGGVAAGHLGGAATDAATAAGQPPVRPGEAEAMATARAVGDRVEVLNQRTETRQVFANPDGTFTSETSAVPERLRRGGGWVPVDTTLRFTPDGSVAPGATALAMRFSGGGTGDLATLTDRGRSMALRWDGPLPRPTLAGATATYPGVLPGVDLVVSATVSGFSEVLVVKDRRAAANPALRRVPFRLRTTDAAARKTADGGIVIADSAGEPVFHSPPARMWDSAGATASETRSLTARPGRGSRVSPLATELRPDELAVVPDPALLDQATFPLYIDPSFTGGKLAWAMVDKAFPTTSYFNNSHRPEAGFYGGSGVKRSFFRMDTDNVNGKHILSATFRITGEWTYNWSCSVKPSVHLYLTGAISSSTTWKNQPSWADHLDSWSGSLGHEGCAVRPIEFNATAAVVQAASKKWSNTTLGLRVPSAEEGNSNYWFGFKNDPKLVINYNSVPSVPTGTATSPGTPCVTGSGRPYLNSTSPKLLAEIFDPDKANDGVRAEFQVNYYNPATSAWEAYGANRTTSYVSSATPVTHSVTLSVSGGGTYSWRVRAYDGTDASGWTGWCEFTVDTSDPASLPQVDSIDYPRDTPDEWHGGVGRPGAFTFRPGAGDTDITGYRYALNDPNVQRSVTAPSAGAPVTAQVAPTHDWLNTLYVWPVDKAGNVGRTYATYDFYVAGASGPVAYWAFDESAGSTVADAGAGSGHPVTLANGAGRSAGRLSRAGKFDGVDDYGVTAGPVLDTTKAFSVSAWVRLTSNSRNNTIISQGGDRASGFQLYYSSGYDRWIFNRHATDTDNPTIIRAVSEQPPVLGAWTHLLGVYDPTYQQLRLYVNGRLQTPATFTTPWRATGPVQLGRLRYNGGYQENFTGDIDEVKLFDRIVSDDPRAGENVELANRPTEVRGAWALDEGGGTTSAGAPGAALTLAGGATWTSDERGGNALQLNGTTGYASASSEVRTADSFTVSTWVRLTADDRNYTAVGKDGAHMSAFFLGYRVFGDGTKAWSFSLPSSDATSGYSWVFVNSAEPPTLGEWTHLVGVYDYPMGKVRLYVNGQLVNELPLASHWNAPGALEVGRAKWKDSMVDHFAGDIDDVRIHVGAMTDREVLDMYLSALLGQ